MLTANSYGDTAMPSQVSSALRSRSIASCERRSRKQATSWRWPILAVVLGLFAHSEALAQRLTNLEIQGTGGQGPGGGVELTQTFAEGRFNYTATAENAVESLTVTATSTDGTVTYDLAEGTETTITTGGVVRPVPVGSTTITVTVTSNTDPPETQDYRIVVRRPADTTLESLDVVFAGGTFLADEMLKPAFDPETRDYEAIVTAVTTAVTVTVDATSPTAEEITWDTGLPGSSHTRNLGTGTPQQNTITATVKDGTSTGRYTIRVTKSNFPGAPRNLRATARNVGKEVALSWSAPSDDGDAAIVGYEVAQYDEFQLEADTDNEFTDGELAWGDDLGEVLSHRVTGLHNGRTYYFRVRARNENGPGNGSNDDSDTPAGPPLAPTSLVPVAGNARVELTWVAPMDPANEPRDGNPISSYDYSQNGSWRSIPNSDESTTSYTATGLNNGTTYQFSVRAKNHAGNGLPSNEVRAVPRAGVPGAPTGLTAQAGDEEVTLSWRAPANNGGEPITRYEYKQETTSGGDSGTWTATGGTGTTVAVPGLTNGTTYYFKVRAVNDLGCDEPEDPGCGQESLEVSAEPFGKPVTVVGEFGATSDEDSRVTLTWSTVPDGGDPADELTGFQYRQKAGGGYGSWIDIRNSDANTERHVVRGLTNGTTYTFEVRAVNSSGGGLASEELSAVPSITPGAPTLTATAGDDEVRLTWTPADDGGRRIIRYECELRIGAGDYEESCADKSLGASVTSLTLTDDDVLTSDDDRITNGRTYTFRVRAVNDRENTVGVGAGNGDWSDEATARPTDGSGTQRTFTISATIDDKSWAKAGSPAKTILATVEVNPRYTAPTTTLWVDVDASEFDPGRPVVFRPTNSERDVSFTGTPSEPAGSSDHITIALFSSEADAGTPSNALAITSVEIRRSTTPDPPTGLEVTRGDGEVTLSWATDAAAADYEYRQRRQPGSYGRWTDFAGEEFQLQNQGRTVTSNTVTGLTNGGTYAFQVRALHTSGAASDPSDEVSVSLSGTPPVQTGPLSAPRSLTATAGNGQVTLGWTPPQSGGASITRYEYRQETTGNAGGTGTWTTTGGTGTTFTVTSLANGTRYYFRVRAVSSDGPGPESSEASATPALTAGGTLSALTLSGVALTPAFTPATRDYTASVGGSVEQVTVTATPTRGTVAITPADDDTAAGHQVDLPVGTTTIRVTVTDGSASGVYTIRVTRAASPPGTDTTLRALVLSHGTLTPSFDPAIRDYRTTVGGSVSQMTVTAAANKSDATVAITPADANTADGHQVDLGVGTTAITVTVTDDSATGAYTIGVTRTGSVPAAPTGLTATGDGDVVLSWTAPASNGLAISSYEYQQKAGADAYGPWTSIPGSGPSTRSYTVTGLTSGTTYAFRVRAVNAAGPGEASNEATALGRLVWARTEMEVADAITAARNAAYGADRRFTRGEAIEVMGEALFEAAPGVRVLYSASTTDADVASASVSGGEVTVTAGATGTADITITANAIPPAGVEILEQTNPREASILFTVDVGFEALTIELSAPSAETDLVEGGRTHANGTLGTVTVTATANRPVTNETTVMLRRDRTASTAGDDDFAAGPIVIEVGQTTGSTEVTAVEDDTPEDREELVLFGVAADNVGEVTGEIRLYLWDAAVPALPLIAQLLLAAFLAIGGYRRYLRR